MSSFTKYGAPWGSNTNPLEIERYCIRHGGSWVDRDGNQCGEGLFHHFRSMQSMLWPEDDHHRWSDLILRNILENRITVVAGCRDSSKTRTVSKWALCDYWCWPDESLFLMTSTTSQGLEMRVFGDIKSLFERALERYPQLEGNVVDSKRGIFTDNVGDSGDDIRKSRDMRKGFIGIPCFPIGTLVDTPFGKSRIEDLKIGQYVINASGVGIIKEKHRRISNSIVRISLCDGRFIDCTEDHPIFTERGWIKAIDLKTYDMVFSACETLSIMWEPAWTRIPQQEILLKEMQVIPSREKLRAMRDAISSMEQKAWNPQWEILFNELCRNLGNSAQMCQKSNQEVQALSEDNEELPLFEGFLFRAVQEPTDSSSVRTVWKSIYLNQGVSSETAHSILRSTMQNSGWVLESCEKKHQTNSRGNDCLEALSRIHLSISHFQREKGQIRKKEILQARYRLSGYQTECRNRWGDPLDAWKSREGRYQDRDSFGTRVVSVEVLESSGDERFIKSEGGYPVYNIEVEGHPSYSVNGVIVHNCMTSEGEYAGMALKNFAGIKQKRRRLIGDELQFMSCDYLKVLDSMDKGEFKAVLLGNMIADNGKALDRVSEPEGGWESVDELPKTKVWKNKYNGTTVNLCGPDSPNFDAETRNRYPYLLAQSDIDSVSSRPGGKDTIEWWSQIMGLRKVGVVSDRPFTINDVRNNNGFKDVVWATAPSKGLAIDAGYGGDDCVKTYFEYGEEVSGTQVLVFREQGVYPVLLSSPITPEDQIANAAKSDCIKYQIPYENVFIEAGMRATLAVSFGRVLSPSINAINFGGTATERPVSNDLFVFDEKTQQRRPKTCYEHYSKFVTELVFAVRDLVMCGQARMFPMVAAEEFQKRKWRFVYGDRYEIETKLEYKERNASKSPNNSDSIMIAVEGARRLGFQIEKMKDHTEEPEPDNWLERELDSQRKFERKHELNYT